MTMHQSLAEKIAALSEVADYFTLNTCDDEDAPRGKSWQCSGFTECDETLVDVFYGAGTSCIQAVESAFDSAMSNELFDDAGVTA